MTPTETSELQLTGNGVIRSSAWLGGANPNDVWMTSTATAHEIVKHFKPSGRILDPCRGGGAFWKQMPGADWCEINEGRNFLDWHEPVDWIVSNPPYSTYDAIMAHAQTVAENIVWLMPVAKAMNSAARLDALKDWGWMKEIRIYGPGNRVGFPVGFVCGAIHFQKGWRHETRWSFAA